MPHARKPKMPVPPGLDQSSSSVGRPSRISRVARRVELMREELKTLRVEAQKLITLADTVVKSKFLERIDLLERVYVYIDWSQFDRPSASSEFNATSSSHSPSDDCCEVTFSDAWDLLEGTFNEHSPVEWQVAQFRIEVELSDECGSLCTKRSCGDSQSRRQNANV